MISLISPLKGQEGEDGKVSVSSFYDEKIEFVPEVDLNMRSLDEMSKNHMSNITKIKDDLDDHSEMRLKSVLDSQSIIDTEKDMLLVNKKNKGVQGESKLKKFKAENKQLKE